MSSCLWLLALVQTATGIWGTNQLAHSCSLLLSLSNSKKEMKVPVGNVDEDEVVISTARECTWIYHYLPELEISTIHNSANPITETFTHDQQQCIKTFRITLLGMAMDKQQHYYTSVLHCNEEMAIMCSKMSYTKTKRKKSEGHNVHLQC